MIEAWLRVVNARPNPARAATALNAKTTLFLRDILLTSALFIALCQPKPPVFKLLIPQ
jgi:hypothetical protein